MRDIIRLGQVETVRKRLGEATQRLLGDTIVLSDEEWTAPTRLPGWTRAHVAAHLSANAYALARFVRGHVNDHPVPLYASEADQVEEIERGAERSGMDLQISLDGSAGELSQAFDEVTDWLVPVRLPAGEFPITAVATARLHEVILHHVDLDVGFSPAELDPVLARWMLQWAARLLRDRPGLPAVELTSTSGNVESVGDLGERRRVTGDDAALWAWLVGRGDAATVEGAEGISFPLSS
ncbi:maleylpyruvate isomerase family mycothiol-dependent enzyme [Nigerium massiliense]|uniref:maleylpyruvate isomerase family mycothiol-dependent enzyme n=1 Tax=Nigerium massiliense TaxID=1522317 RepID=UPI0006944AFF|nr:maleylpyruvate isomerase family mycothiol-dependent enzyme [Nigerium massiliense]